MRKEAINGSTIVKAVNNFAAPVWRRAGQELLPRSHGDRMGKFQAVFDKWLPGAQKRQSQKLENYSKGMAGLRKNMDDVSARNNFKTWGEHNDHPEIAPRLAAKYRLQDRIAGARKELANLSLGPGEGDPFLQNIYQSVRNATNRMQQVGRRDSPFHADNQFPMDKLGAENGSLEKSAASISAIMRPVKRIVSGAVSSGKPSEMLGRLQKYMGTAKGWQAGAPARQERAYNSLLPKHEENLAKLRAVPNGQIAPEALRNAEYTSSNQLNSLQKDMMHQRNGELDIVGDPADVTRNSLVHPDTLEDYLALFRHKNREALTKTGSETMTPRLEGYLTGYMNKQAAGQHSFEFGPGTLPMHQIPKNHPGINPQVYDQKVSAPIFNGDMQKHKTWGTLGEQADNWKAGDKLIGQGQANDSFLGVRSFDYQQDLNKAREGSGQSVAMPDWTQLKQGYGDLGKQFINNANSIPKAGFNAIKGIFSKKPAAPAPKGGMPQSGTPSQYQAPWIQKGLNPMASQLGSQGPFPSQNTIGR